MYCVVSRNSKAIRKEEGINNLIKNAFGCDHDIIIKNIQIIYNLIQHRVTLLITPHPGMTCVLHGALFYMQTQGMVSDNYNLNMFVAIEDIIVTPEYMNYLDIKSSHINMTVTEIGQLR